MARSRRCGSSWCFNSRARGGRDKVQASPPLTPVVFQFTRPRGARPGSIDVAKSLEAFQFTRPRGARPDPAGNIKPSKKFQFTRPRGARPNGKDGL